ncbi:MAG: peptidylprolyl isomerase [Gemmatimonadales bacterium]
MLISLLAGLSGCHRAPALPHVVIGTELGEIEVEIDTIQAPITAGNFLRYVDAGYYAAARFHRTVTPRNQGDRPIQIEVIQGGLDSARFHDFPAIPLERTSLTGLRHRDGAISMARDGPDTATSDFFICIGAQPELDFGGRRNPDGQGFAAFGVVVRGMEVVGKIQAAPAQGQSLTPPVGIVSVARVAPPA